MCNILFMYILATVCVVFLCCGTVHKSNYLFENLNVFPVNVEFYQSDYICLSPGTSVIIESYLMYIITFFTALFCLKNFCFEEKSVSLNKIKNDIKMNESPFLLRSYGWTELAQLYNPTLQPDSVTRMLRCWVAKNTLLADALCQ